MQTGTTAVAGAADRKRRKLSNNKRRKLEMLRHEAVLAWERGDFPAAEAAASAMLEIDAGNPDARNVLALIAWRLNDRATAALLLEQALAAHSDHPDTLRNLAGLRVEQNRLQEAAQLYAGYVRVCPQDAAGWNALAGVCIELHNHADAMAAARKALELDASSAEARMHLAIGRREMNEPWRELMEEAVALAPENADFRFNLGLALLEEGDRAAAEAQLREAVRLRPEHAPAWRMLMDAAPPDEENDDVRAMEALFADGGLEDDARAMLAFALGKARERLKDYDRAFFYYETGNRLHRKSFDYDLEDDARDLEDLIRLFDEDFLAARAADGMPDEAPVFVVGMPRSGSTLIEQILASHPEVEGVGESGLFRNLLTARIGGGGRLDLSRLRDLPAEELRAIGEEYMGVMRGRFPDAVRIVDKALPNLWLIGAIRLCLPGARIVHCRRDPMDNCFSIYANRFVGVLFRYAYDQRELGGHYRLYQRMMAHWRRVLPAGRFYEIEYERLVEAPEREVRALLDFCGLPWSEACLRFHESRRMVRTTSVAQVRRPIYRSSVARWKPFAAHLEPLRQVLEGDAPPQG